MITFRDYFGQYIMLFKPLQGINMRGFEIDCRIKHFQGRIQDGEKIKYTK